jgi:squalene synthase HpnC
VVNPSLADAYAHCQRLARDHYENFPVASRLLPARMRPHIAAIYAFARTADDLADEPGFEADERLRRLDQLGARLHGASAGAPPSTAGEDLIFVALADTIATCRIPVALLDDLLSAFRQDVTTTRYERWTDVLDYCRRSANPVGRLVLRVGGYDGAALTTASDALCTALQLTNFWQDLEKDWRIGRIYVPREDRERAGADETALAAGRFDAAWRRVMAEMIARTREFFAAGRAVCDAVPGRLRWELRLTWLGGSRVLDKIERAGYDVFARRPTLGATDAVPLLTRALTWSTG